MTSVHFSKDKNKNVRRLIDVTCKMKPRNNMLRIYVKGKNEIKMVQIEFRILASLNYLQSYYVY